MEKTENERNSFGLIGRDISYSFSKAYFSKKFADLKLNHSYENFDLKQIEDFEELIKARPDVRGYNVTIPYKESVIAYLDVLDTTAEKIGAVNTIKIFNKGLKGYNTDAFGSQKALIPLLQPHHKKGHDPWYRRGIQGNSICTAQNGHSLYICFKEPRKRSIGLFTVRLPYF
jgi:shikimate dehydrogenase